MKNIGDFILEMDQLLGVKTAFVPAPQQQGGGDPTQGGAAPQQPQQGGDPSQGGGLDQLLAQLPPEVGQQIKQLPPEQQQQALQQVMQQMQGGGGGEQTGGQGQDPNAQQGGDPGATTAQDGSANVNGHVKAENQLDNTQVTLTVRELMDITSGGKATQSLLKVKQMASQHNNKMQADQQKMQQDQQAAAMQQQQASAGMQGGGIYPTPPDMSGKAPQQQ